MVYQAAAGYWTAPLVCPVGLQGGGGSGLRDRSRLGLVTRIGTGVLESGLVSHGHITQATQVDLGGQSTDNLPGSLTHQTDSESGVEATLDCTVILVILFPSITGPCNGILFLFYHLHCVDRKYTTTTFGTLSDEKVSLPGLSRA